MESSNQKVISALEKLPDDVLTHLQFSVPWQYDADTTNQYRDADGFTYVSSDGEVMAKREELQQVCWNKFHTNPQMNTSVRNITGRLTGLGFETCCDEWEVQEVINTIELDPRNRLYNFWPKFVGRAIIEGELFLCLTVHRDGFVEVDYYDPMVITDPDVEHGIAFHPRKTTMPLVYCIEGEDGDEGDQIPSIYCAFYPELMTEARKIQGITQKRLNRSRSRSKSYGKLRGYYRFMVAWDRSFITHRNVGYLRTTIEWLNHYENLKKYEIDHKKSAGAYLWTIEMEDVKAFRTWLSLTDEQRRKTGIARKKVPGSTLILPPGMKLQAVTPRLPKISEEDTDIMQMITSGLNEPEDVTLGSSRSPFASVKASRGPMSDRISDEVAYFSRFMRWDFWRSIFYLRYAVGQMPRYYNVREAIDFKSQEPVFKNVKRTPEELIEVNFPVSEVIDAEARARAYLGVKHGSVYDTLGIPASTIATKLGIHNYRRMRLLKATEDEKFPELLMTIDQESMQEQREAEPSPSKTRRPAKKTKE